MKAMYAAVWTPILQLRFRLELAMAIVLLIVFIITVVRLRGRSEVRPYVIPALAGIISLMMGNLFTVVMIWSQNDLLGPFTPAILGRLGGMACMFLATQQSLSASGEKLKRDATSIAVSAAVSIVVFAVFLYFVNAPGGYFANDVIYSIESSLLCIGIFFNLYIAFSLGDSETARSIRPLNFNFAIYSIFSVAYIVLTFYVYDNVDLEYPLIAMTVLCAGAVLNIPFNLTRGLK